jgi:hypothetical protein
MQQANIIFNTKTSVLHYYAIQKHLETELFPFYSHSVLFMGKKIFFKQWLCNGYSTAAGGNGSS